MSIWRRRTGDKTGSDSSLAGFAAGIVEDAGRPASCRLKISQYAYFRVALAGELRQRGMVYPGLGAVLAGRLVGVCPDCQVRLSAEYLEWLHDADPARCWPWTEEVARFKRGICVNGECSSGDILLYWH